MVALSPAPASEVAQGSCLPAKQRCCPGSRLGAGRSLMGQRPGIWPTLKARASFACRLTGHRAAQAAFPPPTGSSDQEGSYQEVAQPPPAQRLACPTPLTLQPCLLRGALPAGHPLPEETDAPAGSSPGICPEDMWAVSSPLLSSKKEGAGLWAS